MQNPVYANQKRLLFFWLILCPWTSADGANLAREIIKKYASERTKHSPWWRQELCLCSLSDLVGGLIAL